MNTQTEYRFRGRPIYIMNTQTADSFRRRPINTYERSSSTTVKVILFIIVFLFIYYNFLNFS